jgi:hypothetical protein
MPNDEFFAEARSLVPLRRRATGCLHRRCSELGAGVRRWTSAWVAPREDGSTPAVIVSVPHLDDDERALVLGLL